MVNWLLRVGMFVLAGAMYIKGETDTKFFGKDWLLGKTDKIWKYLMGFPMILGCLIAPMSWWPVLSIPAYFLASWALPYGENSPITKLFGKNVACGIHGAGVGAASCFILGWWSVLGAIIGFISFYMIHVYDDAGKIKEPKIAIFRVIGGLCLILF